MVALLFHGHLLLQPEFQALEMDETHRAIAFARIEKWVFFCLLISPADLALNFCSVFCVRTDHTAVNLNRLFFVVLVFTVLAIVHFVPLLYWRSTPVDDPLLL